MIPNGETEYTQTSGPAGVAKYRHPLLTSAAERARLLRLTGTIDPQAPLSERVWNGEDIERTLAQKIGDELEGNFDADPE
jgi:hypothetical protein